MTGELLAAAEDGENPKPVMHRLGQADLRTTARYVHVLDETVESAAKRFEGLLPPLQPSGTDWPGGDSSSIVLLPRHPRLLVTSLSDSAT